MKLCSTLQSGDHYKDILLALERSTNQSREIQEWWIVDQPASSLVTVGGGASLSDRREAGLQLFVFSDKVSPPSLGFLAGYGYKLPSSTAVTQVFLQYSHCNIPSITTVTVVQQSTITPVSVL